MTTITIRPVAAEETLPLRHSVLWPDKPFDYVRLPDDDTGQHFGGFIEKPVRSSRPCRFQEGQLVSVISLFVDTQTNTARFRKFATQPDFQNQGIGTQLLNHVIEQARQAGAAELWCDARLTAAAFYERFGMRAEGGVFYKGAIAYSRFVVRL
jgi:GNAT superfamily N-acetyltransferase